MKAIDDITYTGTRCAALGMAFRNIPTKMSLHNNYTTLCTHQRDNEVKYSEVKGDDEFIVKGYTLMLEHLFHTYFLHIYTYNYYIIVLKPVTHCAYACTET